MEASPEVRSEQSLSPLWPADNPAVIAHLTILQTIISRLANSSASSKTWCLVVVSSLLSLAGAARIPGLITLALVPIIVFGYLDSMYLAQERAYRALWESLTQSIQGGQYDLVKAYELRVSITVCEIVVAFRSWSICPIYFGLVIAYLIGSSSGWFKLLIQAKSDR